MDNYIISRKISGQSVRTLREKLKMTQKEFADLTCSSKRTVENWESKKEPLSGPIVTLIELFMRKPELVNYMRIPPRTTTMRLYYMYNEMVCTVIDVNEINRNITIRNYIDNPLFRAFGVNTQPDYDDYEEFLKSRCFPESRDKMKIELERLGIPFYDPILIIEKTQGRVEGDNFSIKIER